MKHCHVANGQGHPRRKIPKFPNGREGQTFPDRGCNYPVALHLQILLLVPVLSTQQHQPSRTHTLSLYLCIHPKPLLISEGISKLNCCNLQLTTLNDKPSASNSFILIILALYKCFYLLTYLDKQVMLLFIQLIHHMNAEFYNLAYE